MDDLVNQFLEFTGAFDRGTAIEFLKVIYWLLQYLKYVTGR